MRRWTPAPGTLDERVVTGEQPRRHKYGAKPTTVDGIRFASQKEAKRYGELKLLQMAGEIRQLRMQPEFELSVGGKIIGKYVADFEYITPIKGPDSTALKVYWIKVYEDVKGFRTPLYRWKKRHVEAQYNVIIHEV